MQILNSLSGIKKTVGIKLEDKLRKTLYKAPQKCISSIEYARRYKSNGKWYSVGESELICPRPAINLGSTSLDFAENKLSICSGEGVLEISSAFQYGCWIISPEGHLLTNISSYSHFASQSYKDLRIAPRFAKPSRLTGTCLSIATRGGAHYGHWLVESITKLHLFRLAGFDLKDVDYILCHRPTSGTPENLFKQLDIPEKKCMWVDSSSPAFRPDLLFAPSYPEIYLKSLPWIPKFLQSRFLPLTVSRPHRRLYLSREGYSRNPVNSECVNRIFDRHNFESFNPESHPTSHLVFSEAAIVVGHTGSAFAGIVFCQPRTKVLELISDDMLDTEGGNAFTLVSSCECDYNYLVCQSTHHRSNSTIGATPYDFYVNEVELEQALISLICNL